MPNYTSNYNLAKPLGTDLYDVEVQNENMDKIDEALDSKLPLSGGTMTGQGFYINNKTGRIVGNQNGLWLRTASSDVDNNPDSRHLKIWNATYVNELIRALCLFDTTTAKDYIIYGQHNVNVGTSDLTAGESPLANGAIYLMYE